MATIVLLPQIGISEESAVLAAWHRKAGDTVKAGDNLFTVETGKASFDVAAQVSGTVLAVYVTEGEEKPIKAPVCAIGEPGETPPALPGTSGAPTPAETIPSEIKPAAPAPDRAVPAVPQEKTGVSPRARMLAGKAGVDAGAAVPTGPEGRIIERDVRTLLESGTQAAPVASAAAVIGGADGPTAVFTCTPASQYEDKPLTTLRKIIAKNMCASLQNTAQLTHSTSFDASGLLAYRALCKADPDMQGVTLTDMVLFAVTRTLPLFPELNAWFLEDKIRYFSRVNLACAVDTPRGLLVPVLFGADSLSLLGISRALKTLAESCKSGAIAPELLTGGSFTVSNLGQFGVESFTPILNAPQTGILGVCAVTERVRAADGAVKTYPAMGLSLTYDHRAVDGAPASRFLQSLCKNLENFSLLPGR